MVGGWRAGRLINVAALNLEFVTRGYFQRGYGNVLKVSKEG